MKRITKKSTIFILFTDFPCTCAFCLLPLQQIRKHQKLHSCFAFLLLNKKEQAFSSIFILITKLQIIICDVLLSTLKQVMSLFQAHSSTFTLFLALLHLICSLTTDCPLRTLSCPPIRFSSLNGQYTTTSLLFYAAAPCCTRQNSQLNSMLNFHGIRGHVVEKQVNALFTLLASILIVSYYILLFQVNSIFCVYIY